MLSIFLEWCALCTSSTPFGAWYSNHDRPSITTLSAQGREERRKIGVALAFAVELSRQNSPSKPSSVAMVPETSRVSGRCNECTRSSRPLWTPGWMQPLGEWQFWKVLFYVILGMASCLQEKGHDNIASKTPTVQASISVGSVESWRKLCWRGLQKKRNTR